MSRCIVLDAFTDKVSVNPHHHLAKEISSPILKTQQEPQRGYIIFPRPHSWEKERLWVVELAFRVCLTPKLLLVPQPVLCPCHWLVQLGSGSPPCPSTSPRWTQTGTVAWLNDKALGTWGPCVQEPRVQRLGAEPAGLGDLSLLFFLRTAPACLMGSENPPSCELCLPKTLERWCSVAPVETGSV